MKAKNPASNAAQNTVGFLNVLIVILSIYVLSALLIDTLFKLDTEVSRLLSLIDDVICVVFLIDFFDRAHPATLLKIAELPTKRSTADILDGDLGPYLHLTPDYP